MALREEKIVNAEGFMRKGKERKMREAGIDGKYGGRVPQTELGDDAIDRQCIACSGS